MVNARKHQGLLVGVGKLGPLLEEVFHGDQGQLLVSMAVESSQHNLARPQQLQLAGKIPWDYHTRKTRTPRSPLANAVPHNTNFADGGAVDQSLAVLPQLSALFRGLAEWRCGSNPAARPGGRTGVFVA
jgi:hypothetical protein